MRRLKTFLPAVVSAGLIGLLFWRIPLRDVVAAMGEVAWPLIVGVTLTQVVVIWLVDGLSLRRAYSDSGRPLNYRTALRARGLGYLASVVHFSAGQGVVAWLVARQQQQPLIWALARLVMIAYVDLWILLLAASTGAWASGDPRLHAVLVVGLSALAALGSFTLLAVCFHDRITTLLRRSRLGALLADPEINTRRIVSLIPLRIMYQTPSLLQAAAVLAICGVWPGPLMALTAIPIMAIVDAIPVSVSGLGSREWVLIGLLSPERPEMLVAGTLLWWSCVFLGRAAIGLTALWWPRHSRTPHAPT